jgi:phage terminase large subunit-like protein
LKLVVNNDRWSTACLDWQDRIMAGQSLVPDLPLFPNEVKHGLSAFKRLRLPDVIGQPTFGEAMGDWVFEIAAALFGS